MNHRYVLFRHSGCYYCEDCQTRRHTSLRTRNKAHALTLLHARNQSLRQPLLNLQMARLYLSAANPQAATRTWQTVMDEIIRTKTGVNQERWVASAKSKHFHPLRSRVLIETQSEHLLHVLQSDHLSWS